MILGIDIGTSAVKVALLDRSLRCVAVAGAPLSIQRKNALWSEQAPENWWHAVLTACQNLFAKDPNYAGSVRAIGLSGQMHGAVVLDRAHMVIRPAILWNDGRSQSECDKMNVRFPSVGDVVGVLPMPGFTAPKIMWLKAHEPAHYDRIAHVLLPKDYIGLRLHGDLVTDPSDASGTMWFDQAARMWSTDACAASDTDPAWLPAVREGPTVAGQLRADAAEVLGLRPGLPVATGGGDVAAGAVGVGVIADGDALVSLGTSGQLFVATKSYCPNPKSLTHAFSHCVPDMWFQMAAMLNGASPLGWFAGICRVEISTLLNEALDADPARVPLMLPYLSGERTPHGDPDIRGAFYGMDGATTRGEMMRGVVNAIAYSFADAADSLRAGGSEIGSPMAIGGGAQSDLLLQIISDVLDVSIRRVHDAGAGPALGAARLAAVAIGDATLSELRVGPEIDRVFTPIAGNKDKCAAGLEAYRAFYSALKSIRSQAASGTDAPVI